MKRFWILGTLVLAAAVSSCSSGSGSGQPGAGTEPAVTVESAQADSTAAGESAQAEEQTMAAEAAQKDPSAADEPAQEDQSAAAETEQEEPAVRSDQITLDSNQALRQARMAAFEEMRGEAELDDLRSSENLRRSMTFGEATMRYSLQVVGQPGSDGYPVYIALHGGGGTTKAINDSQWNQMQRYYLNSVRSGIYIATRGVRDTWDTHFNPESYPLYERLLENLAIFKNIDTNRVYLLGYSAGGDGVYQISPRLADRFAAVNMSAGHPNGVNLTNLYNTPIALQCGENDTDYDRNLETARYGGVLADLAELYGRDGQPEGYEHRVFLHEGKGHGVIDNDPARSEQTVMADPGDWLENGGTETEQVNTNAVDFVNAYTRNPIPERIVWDLSARPEQSDTESFYWLRASKDVTEGVVIATYDRETNTINVEQNTANGLVYAMVNDDMLDVFSDIYVTADDGQSMMVSVTPSLDYIRKTIEERWDKNMIFAGQLELPSCGGTETAE